MNASAISFEAGLLLPVVDEELLTQDPISRRDFAREGRENIIKPVAKLRHLIPQSVYVSSIIEREISDGDSDS